MNLDYLHYFVVLSKIKHFGRAAEQLYITQPTLSYAIAALEKELNAPLFIRKGKNVALTEEGSIFLKYAEKSLSELQAGINAVQRNNKIESVIKLAIVQTYFVPQIIKPFLAIKKNQAITFALHHDNTYKIIDKLKKDECDLGICYQVHDEPSLEFIPIKESKLVLVVPQGHNLAAFDEIDLGDIANLPLICSAREPFVRNFVGNLFQSIGVTPNIVCETETSSAAASLVANHFGISVMPKFPMLKNYPVKAIPIARPKYELKIALTYVKNRERTPVIESFCSYVIEKSSALSTDDV